ncbi:hypothetical protein HA402_004213 [Bradysia odoriphaga]|nr:hypothetical protein HA402_004213 [Bradysia odoriphaga]
MLQKSGRGKSGFLKLIASGAKILFVAEVAAFSVSYLVWHRMNTNRDFRQYMNDNFPTILEGYYSFGEFMGSDPRIRGIDKAYWDNKEPTRSQ